MNEQVEVKSPCFLVLISSHRGVSRMWLDVEDRGEAIAAGHLAASEVLGLGEGEYNVSATRATKYVKRGEQAR